MKHLTRTTFAAGLLAGAGLILTVAPSAGSPAVVLEASPTATSPIVIEETPRLAQAVQVADVAPVAAQPATPAQEAPTAPAADPPALIADAVLVTRAEAAPAPAPVVTAAPAPAPAAPSTIVDDPAVWVRLPGGYCSEVGRSDVVAGMTIDPTCPAGQPAPPTNPAPGPAVTVYDPLTGSCITMSAADAARLGAHAALPGFCDR